MSEGCEKRTRVGEGRTLRVGRRPRRRSEVKNGFCKILLLKFHALTKKFSVPLLHLLSPEIPQRVSNRRAPPPASGNVSSSTSAFIPPNTSPVSFPPLALKGCTEGPPLTPEKLKPKKVGVRRREETCEEDQEAKARLVEAPHLVFAPRLLFNFERKLKADEVVASTVGKGQFIPSPITD